VLLPEQSYFCIGLRARELINEYTTVYPSVIPPAGMTIIPGMPLSPEAHCRTSKCVGCCRLVEQQSPKPEATLPLFCTRQPFKPADLPFAAARIEAARKKPLTQWNQRLTGFLVVIGGLEPPTPAL
jgi:hypothetical protein